MLSPTQLATIQPTFLILTLQAFALLWQMLKMTGTCALNRKIALLVLKLFFLMVAVLVSGLLRLDCAKVRVDWMVVVILHVLNLLLQWMLQQITVERVRPAVIVLKQDVPGPMLKDALQGVI
jgi:hypothetical protein